MSTWLCVLIGIWGNISIFGIYLNIKENGNKIPLNKDEILYYIFILLWPLVLVLFIIIELSTIVNMHFTYRKICKKYIFQIYEFTFSKNIKLLEDLLDELSKVETGELSISTKVFCKIWSLSILNTKISCKYLYLKERHQFRRILNVYTIKDNLYLIIEK